MGIRRAQRLKSRSEFAAVYRKGRPIRGRLVTLRTLRTNVPGTRFGFTAGKALGGAVLRNRVKRRLREVVRRMPIGGGWRVVINAGNGAVSASHDELEAEVRELLQEAGVLP